MHAGCECNVVIATCPQRDLESTFLRCDNVAFTTLPQPKHNVVTTLSQRDFVCWVADTNMLVSKKPGGPNMKPRRPIAKPHGPNARIWFALAMYISCCLVANANVVSGGI